MRQAGVTEAPVRERRARAWVDFGVDETWEPARRTPTATRTRRERQVDSWVDEADLFAPRYGDDPESPAAPMDESPLHDEEVAERPRPARAERPTDRAGRSTTRSERPTRRATRSESSERDRRSSRRTSRHRGPFAVETETGTVSVDVLAHAAHVPAPVPDAGAADPAFAEGAPAVAGGVPGRRTVKIRGRGAERDLAFAEPGRTRRPPVRRHERPGFKPDRAGLWALLLCVVLVLVAATSSHAATLHHARPAHPPARVAHVVALPASVAPAARVVVVRVAHR